MSSLAAAASCSHATRLTLTDTLIAASPRDVGMDRSLNKTLDSLATSAIARGTAPGIAIAVGRYGRLVHSRGYGKLDWPANSGEVSDSTIYDIASLTKVIATTTAAMILEDEGRLDLDKPIKDYVPEIKAKPKAVITSRMLLTHSAGLEAGAPLYAKYSGRAEYLTQINARPLAYTPGTKTLYSDWDMVLLQAVIERITGQTLDAFTTQRIFAPLGMRDTHFTPTASAPALVNRIAPTENDPKRGGLLRGVVNDRNGYALGGVAGHAGLFSSSRDLAVFAQMLLAGGQYRGTPIVHAETVARWTSRQLAGSSRGLGWDTPAPDASSGHFFSTRSFGHTGFTGTSLWVDPERGVFVVLLMNRINSRGMNDQHIQLRRQVSDAVQSAILDAPLVPWERRLTPRD